MTLADCSSQRVYGAGRYDAPPKGSSPNTFDPSACVGIFCVQLLFASPYYLCTQNAIRGSSRPGSSLRNIVPKNGAELNTA